MQLSYEWNAPDQWQELHILLQQMETLPNLWAVLNFHTLYAILNYMCKCAYEEYDYQGPPTPASGW